VRPAFLLEDQALEAELLAMKNAYTDDLFVSPAGSDDAVVTFLVSRLVVDPERCLYDSLETMAEIVN
jgi:hypothetical protein